MTEYGYRRTYSGYVDYNAADTATQEEMNHNIELNNQETRND